MFKHESVLREEVLRNLNIKKGELYVDCTLGGGGHTEGILGAGGRVLALDIDEQAIEEVDRHNPDAVSTNRLTIVNANYKDIDIVLDGKKIYKIAGAILDLGFSTEQIKYRNIGLSFNDRAELDMRMDKRLNVKANDLLHALSASELKSVFIKYANQEKAGYLAFKIKDFVRDKSVVYANELADYIAKLHRGRVGKLHPATKIFLALRIAVNNEVNNLEQAIFSLYKYIKNNGRLLVITFNSLEENTMCDACKKVGFKKVYPRPILPTREEVIRNPSARSSKLYVYEK